MVYGGVVDDVRRAVALGRPRRMPVLACSEEFDARWYGRYPYEEMCQDGRKTAEVWMAAIQEFDYDWAWLQVDDCFELEPLGVSNVVYSVHMYVPGTFTHQGVYGSGKEYRYPGEIDGQMWDKARLEAVLQPVVDFQRAFGVHVYIGEFSAIRWAPDHSAYRYLKDLIDIFEAHGWDWSYHAFREWDGWSVEHGPDRNDHARSATPTDREELLRSWFARNVKTGEARGD